jgi:hypothetical protein
MAFAEYLAGYFADLGITATVGGASVVGILDDAFSDPLGIVAGTQTVLLLPTTSVGSASVGGTVTIGATSYTIAEIQPDGTGLTRLMLK